MTISTMKQTDDFFVINIEHIFINIHLMEVTDQYLIDPYLWQVSLLCWGNGLVETTR